MPAQMNNIELFVYTAPHISISDETVVTSANQPTTLYIKTEGLPPPEVEWFKDDDTDPLSNPVLSDDSLYIVYTTTNDTGCYTVKATNSVGSAVKTINVSVLEPTPPTG